MSEPFLSEIRVFSFNYAPKGWAMCNGQILPINQNQALFSLLGTTYGGNGIQTFALPNLQGCIPMHMGNGLTLGQTGGEISHVLTMGEMPAHTHIPNANTTAADQTTPSGNYWGNGGLTSYATGGDGSKMNASSIGGFGGGAAHDNMSPYLVLNFCIALQGIFPSRN
jgi:microcystin-dependent protein